jgi:hypothetical protein
MKVTAALAGLLFGLSGIACGSAHSTSPTVAGVHASDRATSAASADSGAVAPSGASTVLERDPVDRDDDRPGSREDPDNDQSLTFGHAANAADSQAIGALIRHYYALAAAGDGVGACSLLHELLVESIAEQNTKHGERVAPAKACARVVSALFRQNHREIVEDLAGVDLVQVRVRERRGLVLVRFGGLRERLIPVRRQGGVWSMDTLLDSGSP